MRSSEWQEIKHIFAAASELPEPNRAAFLSDYSDDLRLEVEKLLNASDSAGDFIAEPALVEFGFAGEDEADLNVGKQIESYIIIREIGHGGMGTVYLANRADDAFDKPVAIKLIKRGMDTTSVLKRFVMERQILAQLEHPNIASLLDGGTTADGLPYFVMEYVEGVPVTKYCEAHGLSIDERLELFRKICSAVSYAHQNLVIHRDIKPSNIVVTADGDPKLLDFGIAKLLNPEWSLDTNEATATMFRLMTPEYASPEQIRGLPITTASDVYSLGVILYEILSGERPYKIESRLPEEVAQIVLTAEPVKPSSVVHSIGNLPAAHNETEGSLIKPTDAVPHTKPNTQDLRSLRGDLDNIVLKALRKEPERRYASVQEFSEDIRRHLDGLPVTATADTAFYRFNKFVTRHRIGVMASGLIVLTLLIATTVTAWQAVVSSRERDKAERRFGEIRRLSNSLITEVQSSLTTIPGTASTQRLLSQKSLEYLDGLAQDEDKDVGVLGELATAYLNVGDLQVSTLNDNAGALQSYQKAVAIERKRMLLALNDAAIKKDLTSGLFKLSEALQNFSRQEELFQACDEIIELEKGMIAADPGNIELLSAITGSYERRGDLLSTFKRNEDAKADFHSALATINQKIYIAKETARDPQARVDLSYAYIEQGSVFADLEEWQDAAESYQTAGQIAEDVYRENPELIQALRFAASSHNQRGDALDKLGDHTGALENYRYALKAVTEARVRNPNSSDLRYSEARDMIKVGIAMYKTGEVSDSFAMVRKGLGSAREYIAEDRARTATIVYGTELFQQVADFLAADGKDEEAIAIYQEALQILERTAAETTQNPGIRYLMTRYETTVGDLDASFDPETKTVKTPSRGDLLKAKTRYQQSLETLRDLEGNGVFYSDLANRLEEVSQKLSACETALAKMKG